MRFEFRAEVFNAFNHPAFGNPGNFFGAGNFGVISSTITDPRELQLALKFYF
jgi:hypothetical protein